MHKPYSIQLLLVALIAFHSCVTVQNRNDNSLTATQFGKNVSKDGAVIIDVRTPEEFSQGHLKNAVNINLNDEGFDDQISRLDKTQPVYVYCLSGSRSDEAAEKMRSGGFIKVYEMEGGLLEWRSAGLPEEKVNRKTPGGMSRQDFEELLVSDKMVLVDFYAPWCGPCRKMSPFLKEIEGEKSESVKIVKINIDDHPDLTRSLKISSIPVLHLYKSKDLIWSTVGYIDKKGVMKILDSSY